MKSAGAVKNHVRWCRSTKGLRLKSGGSGSSASGPPKNAGNDSDDSGDEDVWWACCQRCEKWRRVQRK